MSGSPARVLVVEDDVLVAMDIAQMVKRCGCSVVGPTGKLEEALNLAREIELEGAVLDISLGSDLVWPVADLLHRRDVPFLIATGYSYAEVAERFWGIPLVSKPLRSQELHRSLRDIGVIRG